MEDNLLYERFGIVSEMAMPQFRYSHPRITIGSEDLGQIVFGLNPSKFYVCLKKWEAQCTEVDAHSQKGEVILEDPQYADGCLVQFGEEDDEVQDWYIGHPQYIWKLQVQDWYRAEIVRIEGESARVLYVDYGNEETVPLTKVFDVLCDDLKKHPRLVVGCKLAAVEPGTEDGWSDATKQYFRSLLTADSEYRFTVTFLSQEQDVYTVALTSTNGSSLCQKFVALEAGEVQIVTT